MQTQHYSTKNEEEAGLAPVEAGMKIALVHTKNSSFVASLLGQVGLPRISSADYRHNQTFYRARLLFENALKKAVKLDYNIGRGWNSEEGQ